MGSTLSQPRDPGQVTPGASSSDYGAASAEHVIETTHRAVAEQILQGASYEQARLDGELEL